MKFKTNHSTKHIHVQTFVHIYKLKLRFHEKKEILIKL